MAFFYHAATRAAALALLLLAGCHSTPEPPAPARTPVPAAPAISELRRAFEARHYEGQLRQTMGPSPTQPTRLWTWTPEWARATQTIGGDSATYTYVPLQAQLPTRPYVVTLVGLRRYLLLKHTRRGLTYSLLSYLYAEPPAGSPAAATPEAGPSFFATFTGTVLLKDLATGATARLLYRQGQRQPVAPSAGKAGTGQRTQTCWNYVVCYWSGECESGAVTLGTTTSGIDNCSTPDGNSGGSGCQYDISWTLMGQEVNLQCDPGTGDPGPGPGPGNPNDPGGGNPPTQTPPTPCQGLNILGNQLAFRQAVNTLLGQTGLNHETGYMYSNGGLNGSDYTAVTGLPNDDKIDMPNPAMPLDGCMHTHTPGTLSIFSMSDLAYMWGLNNRNQIMDPSTFTATVFTDSGVDYAIKITDLTQFNSFGSAWLSDDNNIIIFEEGFYSNTSANGYGIGNNRTVVSNERNFLRLLQNEHTGLTLFKHDRTQNSWQQLGLDATNSPVIVPCP